MTTEMTETELRMRDLAFSVAANLEAESRFDPGDWETGDEIPAAVSDYIMDELPEDEDDAREMIAAAWETWREEATESVLDISARVSILSDGIEVSTVTLVLGTGGPHVEIELDGDGDGTVIAYDWFGAGRTEIPVSIPGHPLVSLVEYVKEMVTR